MVNQYKKQVWLAGIGLTALTLGAGVSSLNLLSDFQMPSMKEWLAAAPATADLSLAQDPNSQVLALATQPANRAAKLEAIAKGMPSIDRNRARYLLATDLIQQDRGGKALPWLEGLEKDYPVLAAHILAKRAQAYTATGNPAKAAETWKALLQKHPKDIAAAEALYALGKTNPQYWDQVLTQFPSHPRAVDVASARLEKKPDQPQLLLQIARHGIYTPGILGVLNRLKEEYASKLTPEDWEAIAFAFWEKGYYGSAGAAYGKAPNTPLNMYRTGRGAQLGERTKDAIVAYQELLQAYPTTKEAGQALIKIAELVDKPEAAVPFLDQAINQFPDRAAEALAVKAEVLLALKSPESALQAQQSVITQHSKSETAAKLRWKQVEEHVKQGNIKPAWEWARQLAQENPDSEYAPEASFWIGKWAAQLGQKKESQQAFEYVLSNYPDSYYAWRSASMLGWNVGDFTTVRAQSPQIAESFRRSTPLAGSIATQELYLLGQDLDAWTRWQAEFVNRVQPTVAEQFTDGLMRMGVGDNLDGIFMLSNLSSREPAAEKAQYKTLRQQVGYWEALYPFPYEGLIKQSAKELQINPMLVTALIRQESRFQPKIESSVGATGLMQVMPETADWVAKQIKVKDYSLGNPSDNIKIGTWYLDYTHREYSNNSLFAVASYNAGPGSVADWISRFGFSDPDRFIEQIPFPETKGYVESVFGNYWNYLRLYNPEVSKKLAEYSSEHSALSGAAP
ncbi:MAG: transglycosylase SLT domain-containing protein [Oscillatoriophycideae cyanobacterium NC_groundwater_1537_Pr4_S-0.65um_50_18]|nr:transglycosylase SLT domain-containing protein [Oscillatoriophycideae cyanobacterium NC_groundwater_1537_Pr4_S-0.65um_50_18]